MLLSSHLAGTARIDAEPPRKSAQLYVDYRPITLSTCLRRCPDRPLWGNGAEALQVFGKFVQPTNLFRVFLDRTTFNFPVLQTGHGPRMYRAAIADEMASLI